MNCQNIKVIICDDDKNIRNQIYNYLEAFEACNPCRFDIKTYASGIEMMKSPAIEECELLFLDIEMELLNGIEISHIFREQPGRDELQIIFISAYDRYMKEMFEVRPFNYLSKPISKDQLNTTLKNFLKLHRKICTFFTFQRGRELYRMAYGEILYFESSKRKILLHAREETIDFYGKLDELEASLQENSFFRIHQSYLVNPMHIKIYSAHEVTLTNGLKIPISPKYKKIFLEMQIV